MTWLRVLVSRLAALFRRERMETELKEELRSHLDMLAEENLRHGMPPEEARFAALRDFGGVEQVKESYREQRGLPIMETLAQDVRFGLRQLRRNPGFTLVAALTLALGIGANTAIFSVVNAVVLRPLPYPESSRLVWITENIPLLKAHITGGADYVDWKEQNKSLEQITAYDEGATFNLTGRGTPARVQGAQVSASFFPTLGAQPELGRSFNVEEDQPNGPHVAILMHSFWQQYFGSDSRVLGQSLTLDGTPYNVIGVMPASFKFPGNSEAQFLVPLALNEASERLRQMQRLVHIIGRLKPDVTVARVENDLDVIHKRAESAAFAQAASGPGPAGAPGPGPISGPNPGLNMRFQSGNAPPPGGMPVRTPGDESRRGGFQNLPRRAPGAGALTNPPIQAGAPPQGSAPRMMPAPSGNPRMAPGSAPVRMRPPEVEIQVVPLAEHLAGNLRPAMLIMLGVVGLILVIACANVANLTLARASTRGREVAVRAALGAGRGRLVRQLLTESVVLALAGGVAGLVLAAWGVDVLTRLIPSSLGTDILSLERPHVDAAVLLFALVVSVLTGIFFGLAPALAAARTDLVEQLKEGSQTAIAAGGRDWLRGGLVVAELSLALVVLIGAGLLMKSFYRTLSVDLGFAPEHLLTMSFNLTESRYPKPEQKLAFFSEVLRRAASLPGVRSAALSDSLPLSPFRARLMITPPGFVPAPGSPPGSNMIQMSQIAVSTSYFYTLGIPLLKGRTFIDGDNEQAPHVAVVNEALAQRLWPGQDPVGKDMPLLMGPMNRKMTIVGVVGNTHHDGPGASVESEIYRPYLQAAGDYSQLAVRTTADPTSLAGAIRREVAAVDPEQPIYQVTTLEQTLSESVAPRRFNMLLLGIFAALALVLSTVGIYGVMAFSVAQRTHEIGIRMALGAERREVLRMIVRQGLALTAAGVALGIAGAWALTRFLSGFLYGVRPTDPATFALVSATLVAVSTLASYLPARRATKVDPMVALRCE